MTPEEKREYNRKWYEEHKEQRKEAQKKWCKENPDRVKEYNAKYRNSKHGQIKIKEQHKRYYSEHRTELLEQFKEYNNAHGLANKRANFYVDVQDSLTILLFEDLEDTRIITECDVRLYYEKRFYGERGH